MQQKVFKKTKRIPKSWRGHEFSNGNSSNFRIRWKMTQTRLRYFARQQYSHVNAVNSRKRLAIIVLARRTLVRPVGVEETHSYIKHSIGSQIIISAFELGRRLSFPGVWRCPSAERERERDGKCKIFTLKEFLFIILQLCHYSKFPALFVPVLYKDFWKFRTESKNFLFIAENLRQKLFSLHWWNI